MNIEKISINSASPESLQAQLRMAYLLMLLFLIHFVEACITFPFVDHSTVTQNIIYALIVTAPFYIFTAVFIILKRRDLSLLKK